MKSFECEDREILCSLDSRDSIIWRVSIIFEPNPLFYFHTELENSTFNIDYMQGIIGLWSSK